MPGPNLPAVKNSLQTYLQQINQFSLLNPREEFELSKRYRNNNNDIEAAQKLITSNLKFVVKVAFEYKSYSVKLLDLIQEGNIGLMMAVKKFDPYKGYRFISYAIWWIRAYIQNFIMKSWSLVKIGTTQAQKKLFYKIGKVRKALEAEGESEAKYEHLASDFDVSKADIVAMEQRMAARDLSLDSPLNDDPGLTHLDLLQESSLNQEESLALEEERKIGEREVLRAMKHLNDKEEYVIRNRIMSDSFLTLQEIGNYLKLSRERVRQIESEALKKLRKEMSPGPRTKGLTGGREDAIYEYQCSRCNNVFELLHKMGEDGEAVCPRCMAPAKKLISSTNFVLKGSGFYVNDVPSRFRKDGKRAEKEGSDKVVPVKSEEKKAEKTEKKTS